MGKKETNSEHLANYWLEIDFAKFACVVFSYALRKEEKKKHTWSDTGKNGEELYKP